MAQTIASTHRSAPLLKMLPSLTIVSSFQVLTVTTWNAGDLHDREDGERPLQGSTLWILLRHVGELPGEGHHLEQDQQEERHDEDDPERDDGQASELHTSSFSC